MAYVDASFDIDTSDIVQEVNNELDIDTLRADIADLKLDLNTLKRELQPLLDLIAAIKQS